MIGAASGRAARVSLAALVAGLLAVLVAGCGGGLPARASGDRSGCTPPPSSSPSATAAPDLAAVDVELTPVVRAEGVQVAAFRCGDETLYVALKLGEIHAVVDGRLGAEPVLDLSGEVSSGYEQGVLGLTFAPDGAYLYVHYTARDGAIRVVEYAWRGGRADPGTARPLLEVPTPTEYHSGGGLAFGPDGLLYVAMGDGGNQDNAPDPASLLGSVLRIDPQPSGDQPYTVPDDNPFADVAGARPEIWALGLRNPFTFSFDEQTGDLWIADVGHGEFEEINVAPAGRGGLDFGWPFFEGPAPFVPVPGPPDVWAPDMDEAPADAVAPVYALRHWVGEQDVYCVLVAGETYHGPIPGLDGAFVFAEHCTGEVMALRSAPEGVEVRTVARAGPGPVGVVSSPSGTLYVLSNVEGVLRIDGIG